MLQAVITHFHAIKSVAPLKLEETKRLCGIRQPHFHAIKSVAPLKLEVVPIVGSAATLISTRSKAWPH